MTEIVRVTRETRVRVVLGSANPSIATSVPFLDHMMTTLSRLGDLDLEIEASGDLPHHLVEDVAIAIGMAAAKRADGPIARYGHQVIPMDDAVVECILDLGGRAYYRGPLPSDLYDHWMRSFAEHARATLHLRVLRGSNRHHVVEAAFKGLGRALAQALQPADQVLSTKGAVSIGTSP
jgi:imidazoleglycerol-phosphate dehydratase